MLLPGLGQERGQLRSGLAVHRSHRFSISPPGSPHTASAGETRPLSGLLRWCLSCFLPCTWLKNLGNVQVIQMVTLPECKYTALGPSTSTACPKKSFAEASSRVYAGGNPYTGHPRFPLFLRNSALIPVACLHGKPETQNPISLKSRSGSCTASPSDRAVELQR